MAEYVGLDVSMKETAVSIRRDGKRIWRGKCASDPRLIAEVIRRRAPGATRVVFETGPLSVCMLGRTLVAARNRLVQITTELSNQIRGLMKTFGLVVPAGKGSRFEAHVRALLADQEGLAPILLPLLEAWRAVRLRAAELGRQLVTSARRSEACQILMSVPGVGAVTATSFATAVEDPENFRRSRSVGAWLGLTTRRYQSGEVDDDGPISRRGDTHLRGLLYEAATVILTRTSAESSLRTWGLTLKERIGFKRAAVAVARKLAVVMHAMLRSGQLFDRTAGMAA